MKSSQRRYYKRIKDFAYGILGNKCMVCGETDKRCLQIDHIFAEQKIWRGRKNWGAVASYRQIVTMHKNGHDPKAIFQILCANHHAIKTVENKDWVPKNCMPTEGQEMEAICTQLGLPI